MWTDEELRAATLDRSFESDVYMLVLDVFDDSGNLLGSKAVRVTGEFAVSPEDADLLARAAHEVHRRLQEKKNA